MKTALLLATCIALFFTGGVANAFSTCPMNMDKASVEMQMNAGTDMPCHETKESEDQSSEQCDGCDCQHCVQINALPVQELKNYNEEISIGILSGQIAFSREIKTLLRPPKHLS